MSTAYPLWLWCVLYYLLSGAVFVELLILLDPGSRYRIQQAPGRSLLLALLITLAWPYAMARAYRRAQR